MTSKTLVVLGSGLIGGSLAKAAKQKGIFDSIAVVNRRVDTSEQAVSLGIADSAHSYEELPGILEKLSAGDLVVVAVPVNSYLSVFRLIGDRLPESVVLTDVGSTKERVIEAAVECWGENCGHFVPGHPIAGSEQSGVTASNAELYRNRRVILTPLESNSEVDVKRVSDMWEAVGAEVDLMTPSHHDEILAATSHLPHLLAYGLVDSLVTLDQKSEVFRYAAGGFRDFTRIAESDPVMWRDIFLANTDALVTQLGNFESHLADLRKAIESGDSDVLESILERAQTARKLYAETN